MAGQQKLAKGWQVDPRRLASPLEVEGERWNKFFRLLATSISLFIAVLFGIAAYAPINEVAIAQGTISPTQQPSTLQHSQGGVVSEILISEGELVQKNQIIMRLRGFLDEREKEQMEIRLADGIANISRLEALLHDRPPEFPNNDVEVIERQRTAYAEERQAVRETRQVYHARIAQKEAELVSIGDEFTSLNKERAAHTEMLAMRRALVEEGYGTRRSLIESEAELAKVEGQIARLNGRIEAAKKAVLEAEAGMAQRIAEFKTQWSAELARVTTEVKEIRQQLSGQEDRVRRLAIRAPFDGRVHDLLPSAAGEVVGPGEVIGEIVPRDSRLFAQVQLPPKDVGNVSLGTDAFLTLTAYDTDIHGEFIGRVAKISPNTTTDPEGNSFYQVEIHLDPTMDGATADLALLKPGMELQARILTNQHTMLRYFLRPVYRSLERAFSES